MTTTLHPDVLLAALAAAAPEADAAVDDHGHVDRAGLQHRVVRAASWLDDLGIDRGIVGLQLGNRVDTLALCLAAWRRGATPVNVNRRYTTAEVMGLVQRHGLAAVVTEPAGAADLAAPCREAGRGLGAMGDGFTVVTRVRPGSGVTAPGPEYALMTGGTTGQPRMVAWSLHDIVLGALYPRSHPTVDPDPDVLLARSTPPGPRTLIAAPLDHAFGQWVALAALLEGGTAVFTDRRPLDPAHLLALAHEQRCEAFNVAGQAFVHRLVEALDAGAPPPRRLARLVTGGAPTLDHTERALWRHLPDITIVEGIGASETGTLGRATQTRQHHGDLAPRFVPTQGTLVVGDDLRPVPPGQVGRLARIGWVATRYHGREDHDRFATVDGRHVAVLNDAAVLHDDGTFGLRGRLDRVINTGGQKVHPDEVEEALQSHPAVQECTVTAIPDDTFGERVAAVVCLRAPADETELREHVRARLAGYKVPARILTVPRIPRLDSGKTDLPSVAALLGRVPEPADAATAGSAT